MDDWLIADLHARGIVAPAAAPAATETPGAAIDRLSILELRRYHMREQVERADATPEHREKAASRLEVLDMQREHLVVAPSPAVRGDQEPSTLDDARDESLDVVKDAETHYPRQGSNL